LRPAQGNCPSKPLFMSLAKRILAFIGVGHLFVRAFVML
jgi:hypothetical protein